MNATASNFAFDFLTRLAVALAEQQLDAIVVGNVAAILQGAPVMTQDVDLMVKPSAAARSKVWKLARTIGGEPPYAISSAPGSRGRPGPATVVRIIIPEQVSIDVLYGGLSGGLDFAAVHANSQVLTIGKESLRVAALEDVIASKTAANRPKDLAVLPLLRLTLDAIRARRKQ